MRAFARVDANQKLIVSALRKSGCMVLSLAPLGKGAPDLLIGRQGMIWLAEVKDGKKPPSHRSLTPDQIKWKAKHPQVEVHLITSAAEALRLIGIVT